MSTIDVPRTQYAADPEVPTVREGERNAPPAFDIPPAGRIGFSAGDTSGVPPDALLDGAPPVAVDERRRAGLLLLDCC